MKSLKQTKNSGIIILFSFIVFLITIGTGFSQVNTKQLENKVIQKISSNYLEELKISADQNGIITVEGDISTLFDKLKISELISQVEGVQGINNQIEVKTALTADDIIKDNIEDDLQRNNAILEPEKIKVEVKNGVVNLSGTVSYFREKLMAQSIASWQDGVTDMTSNLVVSSPAAARSDENLKEIISDLLEKHFLLEINVKFAITNGKVTLNGKVKSLYAKDHIQEDIQHLLGVISVTNNLSSENNY